MTGPDQAPPWDAVASAPAAFPPVADVVTASHMGAGVAAAFRREVGGGSGFESSGTYSVGSLCSGYTGLDMGLALALGVPLRHAWHVEYDGLNRKGQLTGPRKILGHRYPDVPNHVDLTTTDWTEVEPVDWLTAGYPCQPFSHAGKRKGADDARHLWPHVADAIRVLRPRRVLLENVAGHLSLGFGPVLGDLAGLGYDACWLRLRAADAGAPHSRARVFIVATDTVLTGAGRDSRGALAPQEPARRGEPGDPHAPRVHHDAAADASGERHGRGEDGRGVGRLDGPDAGEARERERARQKPGDRGAAVPRASAPDADHRLLAEQRRGLAGSEASGQWCDARDDRGSSDSRGGAPTEWGAYASAIHRWEAVLGRPAPRPTEPGRTGERLSPRFVEWLMGLPEGWVTDVPGLPRSAQLKALGNGVVPQQAALAVQLLMSTTAAEVAT